MIPFKIGSKSVKVPTSWSEVSLGQAIALGKAGDDLVKILAAITGLDEDTCFKIRTGDVHQVFIPLIGFLDNPPDPNELLSAPPPEDRIYYDPGNMVWAQHINYEFVLKRDDLTDLEKIAHVIGICTQVPDQYSETVQAELTKEAMNMPLFEAYSIAGFFFRKCQNGQRRQNSLQRSSIPPNRYGQASKSSTGSGCSIRLTPSQVEMQQSGIRYKCFQ